MSDNSLLPNNATPLERALSEVIARLADVSVPLVSLWDADTCPTELLPWLAWALSVDEWGPSWPDDIKRSVLRDSIRVHRYKGTLSAIRCVLQAVPQAVVIEEWYEYGGQPHTFRLLVDGLDTAGVIDSDGYAEIRRLVDSAKPVRSHYGIRVTVSSSRELGIGCAARCVQMLRLAGDVQAVDYIGVGSTISTAGAAKTVTMSRYRLQA
jgi:phage tail P2-like protein